MAEPILAVRSSLLADLRIIVLGSWAFLLQTFRSWRVTHELSEQSDDQRES